MLAIVKEVFANGYTLYVYPKPYKSQVWRIYTDNNQFVAGNCVDYDLKSKTVKQNFKIVWNAFFHFNGLID